MSSSNNNPAALDGWVKSVDPKSGRAFYANHITRVTQWEPPSDWIDSEASSSLTDLPPGWEELRDPASGRSFYVDHARQITTWTKPTMNPHSVGVSRTTTSTTTTTAGSSTSLGMQTSTSPIARSTSTPVNSNWLQQASPNHYAASPAPYAPTNTTTTTSSTVTRVKRSWSHDSSYFRPSANLQDDFSDSLSKLDFKVQTVEDKFRPTCASCGSPWTLSKRRHHCRLCGDVYCHDCSPYKVELPLEGPEFQKPVRICKLCHPEVEQGNYFSLRRYLTPLQLYDPPENERHLDQEEGVATHQTVSAALSALTSDLDALVMNATNVEQRLQAADVLVPVITKHLRLRATSDRAICALASLLSLGAIVQRTDYSQAVHTQPAALNDILTLLERSGSDRRTLYVQEQAAKTLYYLTDRDVLALVHTPTLDLPRTFRAMLDHASLSKNPQLQRWAASTLRHLVQEEERRTTASSNEIASALAAGLEPNTQPYQAFLPELVSTGGILILCSLIGADDSETRAHATGALGATLEATRAMEASRTTLYELTGTGSFEKDTDAPLVQAIVQAGGCGTALSLLLQSAENEVARMGCDFCASLVQPLLEDARGTQTLPEGYTCDSDSSGLGACRQAAMAMASGPCLPSLLSLLRDPELGGRMNRPIELKKAAMETLAAVSMAVGEMSKANPDFCDNAVSTMLEEGIVSIMLAILESSSSQSLLTDKDTPSSRIREAGGICISAMAMCSADAMMELQSSHAITSMLAAMSDPGMAAMSNMRGDGAPRCLGMLQTAAALLTYSQHDSGESEILDRLLEAVDAGAISTLSRILFTKLDWNSQDKAVGGMKARDACCRMLTAMFGMARHDDMAHQRLWDVVDADAFQRDPPRTIVTAALGILQQAGGYGQRILMGTYEVGPHFHAAVMDLVESSLYAVGSMCGSTVVPGLEHVVESAQLVEKSRDDDAFAVRRKEASAVACDILTARSRNNSQPILPTMLVGGFGEKTLTASLRLALAIAQNGSMEQHAKLAASGIMVPISDALKNAMNTGDEFRFSACLSLVKFCGPHVGAGQGGLQSVQAAIRTATHVLNVPVDPSAPIEHINNTEALKSSCIQTLESLSSNASLWSAISKDAFPSIVSYLHSACDFGIESGTRMKTLCGALRAIARIVGLQSHAVSAARSGLVEPLGRLLIKATEGTALESGDDELPLLALEVLHVLSNNAEARKEAGLLESGVIEGVCCALGKSATFSPRKPEDGRADICFWAIEILLKFLDDLGLKAGIQTVLASPKMPSFLEVVSREPRLVKALCSTLLVKTNMKIPVFDDDSEEGATLDVPKLYGPPLLLVKEPCGGFINTHAAALYFLFSITVLSCVTESTASDLVWETMLCLNEKANSADNHRLAATLCAYYLSQLSDDKDSPFLPVDPRLKKDFDVIARPVVRHQLLEGLKSSLGDRASDPYMMSMLVAFEVPGVCLSIWQDSNLIQSAFELIRLMVDSHEQDLVHVFVESKHTLLSLFDMLNADSFVEASDDQVEEIRAVVANILGSLAENGLLTEAVEKFDIKSAAIGGLAAACLAEERQGDDDGDQLATSATLSSRCMECLVDLLKGSNEQGMALEQADAEAIAGRLGQKICHMVISRFLERAKLSHYEIEEEEAVMDAPDVKMLCAIAQHKSALNILCSLGGISALALVAGEGVLSAIVALKHADPAALLDADGHKSIMKLLLEGEITPEVETAVLELLADLTSVRTGLAAVAESTECADCIHHCLHVIGALVLTNNNQKDHDTEDLSEEGTEPMKEPKKSAVPEEPKTSTATSTPQQKQFAVKLLTNLISIDDCRREMLKNESILKTVSEMSKEPSYQTESARFLSKLAPFATTTESDGEVSADNLAEIFADTIKRPSSISAKDVAAEGLIVVIHDVSPEQQKKSLQAVSSVFQANVKKTTVSRSIESVSDQAIIAHMMCSFAALIVQVAGKDHLRDIFTDVELLKSMVHVIEWRYDARSGADDEFYWDAVVSFSIQHLATILCGTYDSQSNLSVGSLTTTVLTMARPGKAPRKTCDFKTALKRVVEAKRDVSGSVSAARILARLSSG